ncbi:MAG: substrate-binding domain-containing protein [Actinobacteria bacterium]|nr:substrate-binding domain-containing protein [Actinomycetota bacterium]
MSFKALGPVVLAAVALVVLVAACGGGGSSSGSSPSTESETTAKTTAEAGSGEGDAAAGAAKAVAPYISKPSAFPVTEALKKVPKGATVDFVDTGTPFSALQWELLAPAAQVMGVKVERIKAGTAANTVGAALDTVVAKKPDAVLVGAIPVELWSKQLTELREEGVTVVVSGIVEGEEYELEPVQSGKADDERNGRLLANYVIGKMNPKANTVIYTVPELPVINLVAEEFAKEFAALCPECELRTVSIPASTMGNTAPTAVVSDLQANPETEVAVFAADEIENGVPAALSAAGIEVETLGYAPSPVNLQYIKEGKETAALAYDVGIQVWTQLDQAARDMGGQKLTGPQAEGLGVIQFLTKEDITFDISRGWTGYPDFPERFAKLWGVG